jgi:hypothetical protein
LEEELSIDWGLIGVVIFAVAVFFATELAFQYFDQKKRGMR